MKERDEDEEDGDDEDESDIEFERSITALSATEIEVDGFGPILVATTTVIRGNLFLGAEVEVKAVISNGDYVATRIKVENELEIEDGIVASATSTALVLADGTTFTIDDDTRIRGTLAIGARVEIEAEIQPDGSLLATRIRVERRLEFDGTIASIGSTMLELADGTIFVIDDDTRLRGALVAGASVQVEAEFEPDGSLLATRVRGERRLEFESSVVRFTPTSLEIADGTVFVIDDDTRIKVEELEYDGEEDGDDGDEDRDGGEDGDRQDEEDGERERLEFTGTVASFSTSTLVLIEDDLTFVIDDDTRIRGTLAVDATVEVRAEVAADGSLIATRITVEECDEFEEQAQGNGSSNGDNDDEQGRRERLELTGTVASFSTSTLVLVEDDRSFVINDDTRTRGTIAVGATVVVRAEVAADGSLIATRITVEERDEFEEQAQGNGSSNGENDDEQGRRERLELTGTVASFSTSTLVLVEDDRALVINDDTRTRGTLAVDATVEVRARWPRMGR